MTMIKKHLTLVPKKSKCKRPKMNIRELDDRLDVHRLLTRHKRFKHIPFKYTIVDNDFEGILNNDGLHYMDEYEQQLEQKPLSQYSDSLSYTRSKLLDIVKLKEHVVDILDYRILHDLYIPDYIVCLEYNKYLQARARSKHDNPKVLVFDYQQRLEYKRKKECCCRC